MNEEENEDDIEIASSLSIEKSINQKSKNLETISLNSNQNV